MKIAILHLLVMLILPLMITAQDTTFRASVIIDMHKDSGVVVIRDYQSGLIQMFRPHALEIAALNVGDTIQISAQSTHVNLVRGIKKNYPLLQPDYGLPCCTITKIAPGDPCCYTITALNVNGEKFSFHVPDSLAVSLNTIGKVYTQPSHGYAMIHVASKSDSTFRQLYGFPLLQQTNTSSKH